MTSSDFQTTAQATIVETVMTGSRSHEEILRRLKECDIECYITEEGDLMIKYWQVGAEGFVPAGRVAELRARNPATSGAEALEWVSKHLSELQARHGGKWVAVADGAVLASADDLPSLMVVLEDIDVDSPFVTQIPPGPIVWHTLYGN